MHHLGFHIITYKVNEYRIGCQSLVNYTLNKTGQELEGDSFVRSNTMGFTKQLVVKKE